MQTLEKIKEFNFIGNNVRVVDRDGEPWFVLADVARTLKILNAPQLAGQLRPQQKYMFDIGLKNNQPVTIISESGLYRILMRSDKPEAEKF